MALVLLPGLSSLIDDISEEKKQSESEWDYDTYGHGA